MIGFRDHPFALLASAHRVMSTLSILYDDFIVETP
jgi:hypothetical protein